MGSLSPKTRNAQVELYQSGDVDFLVATDAIGMGINMDLDHVYFSNLKKFDGKKLRKLNLAEIGQIAGRAGRYLNDGNFGITGECKEINAEEYAEIMNSSSPVVIDCHATWCGPCKVLSPILEELNDEIEGVEFVKLDVDQHPQIAGQNQVMGVPTVVILKDGEVKDRFVGVQPKEVIKEKITSLG